MTEAPNKMSINDNEDLEEFFLSLLNVYENATQILNVSGKESRLIYQDVWNFIKLYKEKYKNSNILFRNMMFEYVIHTQFSY